MSPLAPIPTPAPATAPSFVSPLVLRTTPFHPYFPSPRRRRPSHVPPICPPTAVFDFVRRAGEEQKKAFDAIRSGKGVDYVKDKVRRDLDQVSKFNDGLAKSRERLARDLGAIVSGGALNPGDLDDVLDDLEEVLITSDLGVDTVDTILSDLRDEARAKRLTQREDIIVVLKESLVRILSAAGDTPQLACRNVDSEGEGPTIVLVIGANGMGKTTTIGKLATRLRRDGKSVLVAACDTFRAAAAEQLTEWVRRADAEIIVPDKGVKASSAVLYSALQRAHDEKFDYLLVDTSGRLHTNANLMGELQKMVGVVGKFREDGPHETLLVVDASIGRNAVSQARTWQKDVGVSALAVTKLDGTARAGFVVSCVDELQLPVKFVGVGEGVDDLRDFDAELFVDGLVG